jgi:hypothetical protein
MIRNGLGWMRLILLVACLVMAAGGILATTVAYSDDGDGTCPGAGCVPCKPGNCCECAVLQPSGTICLSPCPGGGQ